MATGEHECFVTNNGPNKGDRWGCEKDSDCCNPSAECSSTTKLCTLPCRVANNPFIYKVLIVLTNASAATLDDEHAAALAQAISTALSLDKDSVVVENSDLIRKRSRLQELFIQSVDVTITLFQKAVPVEFASNYAGLAAYYNSLFVTPDVQELVVTIYQLNLLNAGLPKEGKLNMVVFSADSLPSYAPSMAPAINTEHGRTSNSSSKILGLDSNSFVGVVVAVSFFLLALVGYVAYVCLHVTDTPHRKMSTSVPELSKIDTEDDHSNWRKYIMNLGMGEKSNHTTLEVQSDQLVLQDDVDVSDSLTLAYPSYLESFDHNANVLVSDANDECISHK